MKRFFIRIYDALSHKINARRRKEYVRRMEHLFYANIGTCFARVNSSTTNFYIKCDEFLIYQITDVSDMQNGTIGINDIHNFIDMLHDRWMLSKQYTKEEIDKYCNH